MKGQGLTPSGSPTRRRTTTRRSTATARRACLSSTTPIDEDNVHVRWIFTTPKSNGEGATKQAAESFCSGVSQDIPIWENKVYRERPVLTKGESGIVAHGGVSPFRWLARATDVLA